MARIKISEIKKALSGQVDFGPEYSTPEKIINKVFGIAESVAEVPSYNAHGNMVGVQEMVVNRRLVAESRGDFDSLGAEAFGRELMGNSFYAEVDAALQDATFWQRCRASMKRRIGESVQADTASLYSPINVWGSYALGLLYRQILQGYDSAPRVFEKLIPDVPTMVHGGVKHVLHSYDGTLPSYDGLTELQEEDTARGVPAWVWSQDQKEFGLQYAITMEALKSDLDGGLGRHAEEIGIALAKLENYRGGSTYLGYRNEYCFNTQDNSTPSCNTFLSSSDTGTGYTAAAPFNYVNKFYSTPLMSVDTLDQAYIQMLQLQSPVTGWRMDVGNSFRLVVSPTLYMRALQLVHSIRDYLAILGGIAPTTGVGRAMEGENALKLRNLDIEVVDMGQEWKDVLTGGMNAGNVQTITSNGPPASWSDYQGNKANVSYANPLTQCTTETPYNLMSTSGLVATAATSTGDTADNIWYLESKKHRYMQRDVWYPVTPRTFLLAGTDMARRIGMRGDVIQATRFTTLEPRAIQCNLPHASGVR